MDLCKMLSTKYGVQFVLNPIKWNSGLVQGSGEFMMVVRRCRALSVSDSLTRLL